MCISSPNVYMVAISEKHKCSECHLTLYCTRSYAIADTIGNGQVLNIQLLLCQILSISCRQKGTYIDVLMPNENTLEYVGAHRFMI